VRAVILDARGETRAENEGGKKAEGDVDDDEQNEDS
jgi:hypothetical protein